MPRPLVIDTDTGIDDAVAIALAACLPALDVVAITTVHGNVDTARATRNAREVARRCGLRAPVVAGSARPLIRAPRPARETHGEEGLGFVTPAAAAVAEPDHAAQHIVDESHRHHALTLCCLGPLTNLANALERDATLPSRLGPVFVMGGALAVRGTMTRWSEFNWWSDPEAVDRVLRAALDVRLVPLDVTRQVAIPGSAIRQLGRAAVSDADARFWYDALRFYAGFHRDWEQFDGAVVNDALAIALVADDRLAGWETMRVGVGLGDDDRQGALTTGATGHTPLRVAVSVNAPDVLALISRLLFSRWVDDGVVQSGAADARRWLSDNPLQSDAP
ncbi:MAG: nucleoside hydrolase [Gemmatimonadota bacterium]|nr:nucleoside hydrolase [Gemmatimonadota bacterium]